MLRNVSIKKHLLLLTLCVLFGAVILSSSSAQAASKKKNGWSGDRYYVNGKMLTGSHKIKNNYYLFDKTTGKKRTNVWVRHKKYGKLVYYKKNGKRALGKTKICGVTYKFDKKTGVLKSKIYTSGVRADNMAIQVLNQIGYSLRSAFYWSKMPWVRSEVSGSLGEGYYAKFGLQNHYGNCYVMAGTFCALARQLGYEAYQVSGYVPSAGGGITPHSWVDIKVNGGWYICDPDFEKETGRNGYLIGYGTPGAWSKISYWRMPG